jgi:NADPH:quinone reductase-like Zn-dependent oxidoreductase
MRGLTISAHGGLDRLELRDDLPVPPLVRDTDVRIRVHAAALNHLDLFVVGGLPGVRITPPWIVGSDGAGVVDAVGSAVAHVAIGDPVLLNPGTSDRRCEYCLSGDQPLCREYRIFGEHLPGTLAESMVVPGINVARVAPGTDMTEAAAFPLATLTAWRMMTTRARVTAQDHVLIWGIGGGVAIACLQISKLLGARVTVTSGSDEKLARARALGADDTINHRNLDVGREIRSRTAKRGVDLVVDSVGEATWTQSLGALGKRGRIVTCGGTSGPMLTTDVRKLFWNQWTILGSTMGSESEFAEIVAHFNAGRLRPPIDQVFELDDAVEAYERLASGEQFGKVVVRLP